MSDPFLIPIVAALSTVPGVVAIVLGGSRGRGTAGPHSDYDIGLYYRDARPINTDALGTAMSPLVDGGAPSVTRIGEWGRWINGGGWLVIQGQKTDLLYRELGRVEAVIADAHAGRFTMDYQVGHPHGFGSPILMGEIATCHLLHDPHGQAAKVKATTQPYPRALGDAIILRLGWEVGFAIDNARLAARRDEQNHVAGCAYRALSCLAQVIFAYNGRYLTNEKGAVAEAAAMPITISGLQASTAAVWRDIGKGQLDSAIDRLARLHEAMGQLDSATKAD